MLPQNVKLEGKTVLVTGAAGFIGSNLVRRLLADVRDIRIVGIDNMNDYYDVRLKEERLKALEGHPGFIFVKGDISDRAQIDRLFATYRPEVVVNLAAQAGVRYSITNPEAYIASNLIGFYNILEACRHSYDNGASGVEHLVYASSSSVYGSNKKVPYSTDDKVDNPVSLYAATKKSNELLAHAYAKLYNIPSTGLRFFTVYGPAGRPDMAYFGFTDKLVRGEKIRIFTPNGRRVRMAFRCRPIWSTISATATRRICWTLWIFCSRSWCVPAYCLRTTILRRTRSWSRCSRATCPSPMPIPPRWNGISVSSQAPH